MPNYYSPYYQQYAVANNPTPATPQIQNSGFVSIRSENEARNYPVAFGNSVTFKDENAPYIYTKTMGFSQLDNPIFEKYRLVKESPSEAPKVPQSGEIDIQSIILSIDKANEQIEALWVEIDRIKNAKEKSVSKVGNSKRDKSGDDRDDE